jgi:hypothetical protein
MPNATPKVLIAHQDAEAASTQKYVSPSNGKGTWIDKFTGRNHAAGTQSLSVWLVPAGGTADNTNLVKVKSFASGEEYAFPELVGKFLAAGDSIYWQATAGASISGGANGRELT